MAIKLDLKDQKILYELDLDARQPSTKIAKKVGLSTEVVNYRIKKLEQEEIITQYQTIINLSKMGVIQFKILLALQHMKSEKLKSIVDKLKKKKEVKWLVSCNGAWDLIFTIETDSIHNVERLKNETLSLFSGHIDKKALSIGVKASAYQRNFLLKGKIGNKERVIINEDKQVKIDALDLKILKKLSENARKSIVDIASELNKSARMINYRIQQLLKKGIITGFRIALNYEKLGIKFFKGFIYLDNPKEEKIKQIESYFENNKNIIHNVKIIGNWEMEPEFEVYSEQELNKILEEIKDKFSDTIKKIDLITISKEHKFVYF